MSTDHHVDQVADASVATVSSTTPSLSALPQARRRRRGRQLVKPSAAVGSQLTPEQRLLVLDTWQRSGLPAGDFAPLCGVSKHTLYGWKKRFAEQGPAGLEDKPRGAPKGSRVTDTTRRAILLMKEQHPDWGVERISTLLLRGPALPVSPNAVARVLREAGYVSEERRTKPHTDKIRRFERARPGQLWQTDLFSFVLKRQNRRVHLVAFMDDHSRYITCWGLHATASAAMVIEVLRSGIANYQPPEEILTDNGPQYITWRGVSKFAKECEKRGIKQIVATPRRPQTLGKVERFWGTLWRECLEAAIFIDLGDAQKRIGHFIDYYNFQRTHSGIDGLVPADRFFGAAPAVLKTLRERVSNNALDLARNGTPKAPLYLTGNIGGKNVSVHAEGDRVFLQKDGEEREEVAMDSPAPEPVPEPVSMPGISGEENWSSESEPAPGVSPLDFAPQQPAPEETPPKTEELSHAP